MMVVTVERLRDLTEKKQRKLKTASNHTYTPLGHMLVLDSVRKDRMKCKNKLAGVTKYCVGMSPYEVCVCTRMHKQTGGARIVIAVGYDKSVLQYIVTSEEGFVFREGRIETCFNIKGPK